MSNLDEKNGSGRKPPGQPNKPNMLSFLIIGIVITFVLNLFSSNITARQKVQVEYSQFIQLVEQGAVKQVQLDDQQIAFYLKEEADRGMVGAILQIPADSQESTPRTGLFSSSRIANQVYYTGVLNDPGLTERLLRNSVAFYKPIIQSNPIRDFISSWVLP
ncbi:MAG: ATP-dependent metallopeptidase FtsH/Yme1/Tma family protein, partial [Treponema sp.]|nr:ATP-dependent metallopeptidase FtsH/Yme1/Tma family protein [Treponema sp.]